MDLSLVEIVLVRPSRPANVAAACRAMKNMGLRAALDRRAARRAWTSPKRDRSPTAPGTSWTGRGGRASLLEAVAASVAVVGTTGREVPGAVYAPRGWRRRPTPWPAAGRLSLVFGPESSGLTRAEMDLCHALVHVPTDPAQPSLNLAQAVLLLAYEMRLAALDRPARLRRRTPRSGPRPATWSRR